MVIIMKSNHLHITNKNYTYKPLRKNAIALHKLYDCEKVHVPTVKEILIHRISLSKHFNEFLGGLDEFEVNEDEMNEEIALCNFLGIDYDGIVPYDPSKNDLKF